MPTKKLQLSMRIFCCQFTIQTSQNSKKNALEVAFPVKTVKKFHPHLQVEDVSIKTEFDWQLLPFPMSLYKSEPFSTSEPFFNFLQIGHLFLLVAFLAEKDVQRQMAEKDVPGYLVGGFKTIHLKNMQPSNWVKIFPKFWGENSKKN